ncbi:hypothetical protein ACVXG7_23810 [Enterobacter hormaechei]
MSPFHFHRSLIRHRHDAESMAAGRVNNACAACLHRAVKSPTPYWPLAFRTAAVTTVKPTARWA